MMSATETPDDQLPDGEMSLDEIEAAYMLALEVSEAAEAMLPTEEREEQSNEENWTDEVEESEVEVDDEAEDNHSAAEFEPSSVEDVGKPVTPTQVIEAVLFVGGDPIPAKKFIDILGGTTTHEQVDLLIEELNEQYVSENRPYEVHLIEGGYTLTLKSEFETVRRRVYGQGPKDVKLSQEALEVLAFVAYRQPMKKAELEVLGKKNGASLLRQLLRRELVSLRRDEESKEETYETTKRFLDLFGLKEIADLPQPIDFNFK